MRISEISSITNAVTPIHSLPTIPTIASAQQARYRYGDMDSADTRLRNFRAPPNLQHAARSKRASVPNVSSSIASLLGLSGCGQYNPELRAIMHHFDSCHLLDLTHEREALIAGWSKIRQIEPTQAKSQLMRISAAFQNIFFKLPPPQRATAWAALPHAVKIELNLAVNIFDALRAQAATSTEHNAADAHACIGLAKAFNMPPDASFPRADLAYLLALSAELRHLDAAQATFFDDRIAIEPSDIQDFVGLSTTDNDNANATYAFHRYYDLIVLRFAAGHAQGCSAMPQPATLAHMYTAWYLAMANELRDSAIMERMFKISDDFSKIYHTGISFHNAFGKDIDALIAYLDTQADPTFVPLAPSEKRRLVRNKLYRLQESPDYPIGSVQQTMATILMRMSNRPLTNRYLRYDDKYHLLECWEARHKQWIKNRDFEFSPDLYNAMHMAGSTGVHHCTLSWYRNIWQKKIIDPISNAAAVRNATPEDQATLWRWLAKRTPGWSATSHRWYAITPGQYANAVTSAVEALYNIKQATNLPYYELYDTYTGAGFYVYHASLFELTPPIRAAISAIAKAFTSRILSTELVLSDDWLTTSYRLLDIAHYRIMLEMQEPPSYSLEIDAYLVLSEHGITHAQMSDVSARVQCPVDDNPYHRRLRPVHEAFIAVIRNPHSEARLQLPNGKLIDPHAIIERRFKRYRDGLTTHGWVVGRARQNLRDRGIPLFPRLLKTEIDTVAAPFLKSASKATASGTELADHFFGAMPVSYPLLKMSRAVRAGNYSDVPYYSLILTRDIIAIAALRSALGAAYLVPAKITVRYGSAALLGLSAASTKRTLGLNSSIKLRKGFHEKQSDVSFNGDQAHNIQGKVLRRSSHNNAARHYSAKSISNNTGNDNPQRFDADDWQNMLTLLLPLDLQEADRQRQKVMAIIAAKGNTLLNITVIEDTSEIGNPAGLLGLSQINADTWCDGQQLGQRNTVLAAEDWRLKTDSAQPLPAQKLISGHLTVKLGDGVESAWQAQPVLRYDPLNMLVDVYEKSQQLRKLLHWHDDHALENHLFNICIEMDCHAPQISHSALWGTVDIVLPGDPTQLPFIMNEQQIVRPSILQAMLESVITAITGAAPPPDKMTERGINIWLSNQALLEHGEVFIPRINAASLHTDARLLKQQQLAHTNAEQEDQYLERIVTEYQASPQHARFQGEEILQRPTVLEVVACLERINYPAYLHSVQPAVAEDAQARADFKQRFENRFVIDPGSPNVLDPTMVDLFLFNCYADSSLFRRLFDHGQSTQRWTIYPAGVYAPGPLQYDVLIPREGIINANVQDALYMGLAETRTNASNVATPQAPMQAQEALRRFLDGIIAVLSDHHTPNFDTTKHRGAAVWISDAILWQAGMPANKRLARIVVPAAATAEITHLNALAAANRRFARVEDAFLMMWLNQKKTP